MYFADSYFVKEKNMTLPEKVAEAKAEHFAHIIPPHSRQWCLRRATLNCFLQIGQNFTSLSAIQGTRLFSRARNKKLMSILCFIFHSLNQENKLVTCRSGYLCDSLKDINYFLCSSCLVLIITITISSNVIGA